MSDQNDVDKTADQYLAALDYPIRMVKSADKVYKDIIKRLLTGWQPNYHLGEMTKEWHHPYKPFNNIEDMTDEELAIIVEIDNELVEEGFSKREGLNE